MNFSPVFSGVKAENSFGPASMGFWEKNFFDQPYRLRKQELSDFGSQERTIY